MNGYSIRPLSSQKRTKTVDSTQPTATWVTRSASHGSKADAVRSAVRAACHSALSFGSAEAGRLQVRFQRLYLLL